jgi:hypothetical protein
MDVGDIDFDDEEGMGVEEKVKVEPQEADVKPEVKIER